MRIFSQKQQQALKPSSDKVRHAGKERPEGDEGPLTRGEDSLLLLHQTVGNQAFQQLLNLRTIENARNGSVFVGRYSSMFSKIWTGYVTKEMEKAIEEAGWSF